MTKEGIYEAYMTICATLDVHTVLQNETLRGVQGRLNRRLIALLRMLMLLALSRTFVVFDALLSRELIC